MRAESAVMEMARLGFRFRIEGEAVKVRWEGQDKPDPTQVAPLLEVLKANKEQVRNYLARTKVSSPPERVLTCFECPRHEHDPINPPEGWGRCTFKGKWCYGLRPACSEIQRQDTLIPLDG
jgi:hypothetical protein